MLWVAMTMTWRLTNNPQQSLLDGALQLALSRPHATVFSFSMCEPVNPNSSAVGSFHSKGHAFLGFAAAAQSDFSAEHSKVFGLKQESVSTRQNNPSLNRINLNVILFTSSTGN